LKMKAKKICMFTSVHSALDVRIFYKEANTLVKEGYNIVLIAQHNKKETINGVRIIPLPKPRNRFERMAKVVWKLFISALRERADIYHFHDPELIFVGLTLKLFGKKVIYDMHELVYFQIEDKYWLKFRIIKKLMQWVYLLFEMLSIKCFDQLILAEDGYESYFTQRYKNFKRYTIIRNFPIVSLIKSAEPINNGIKQNPTIIYVGGLKRINGIKEIIKSMEYIKRRAELWLLGKWESEKYKKECEDLSGWKYTKYLGNKSLEEVYTCLKISKVGISILYPVKNYLTSLPLKTFEYMACSLPIVMSNFHCWQEVFGECALFANPYDSKNIADKIIFLLDKPNKARKFGKRGRKLIEEKYNWETESKKLIMLYSSLLEEEELEQK